MTDYQRPSDAFTPAEKILAQMLAASMRDYATLHAAVVVETTALPMVRERILAAVER